MAMAALRATGNPTRRDLPSGTAEDDDGDGNGVNDGDGDGDGNGDGDDDGAGDGDGDSDGDSDGDENGAADVAIASEVLAVYHRLYELVGADGKPTTDLNPPVTVNGRRRRRCHEMLETELAHEWKNPLLNQARAVDAANNEALVHLSGRKLWFLHPEVNSGVDPACPVCSGHKIIFKQLGSTGSPVRSCAPGGWFAAAQYVFSKHCVTAGCPERWKAGGGAGSKGLWAYQTEIYSQQPPYMQQCIELEFHVHGQGTAFSVTFNDICQYAHGAGIGFKKLEKMMASLNNQRFDRAQIACRNYKRRLGGQVAIASTVAAVTVDKPTVEYGYKNVTSPTIKAHVENYWYKNQYDWIRLFIQGVPFNFIR